MKSSAFICCVCGIRRVKNAGQRPRGTQLGRRGRWQTGWSRVVVPGCPVVMCPCQGGVPRGVRGSSSAGLGAATPRVPLGRPHGAAWRRDAESAVQTIMAYYRALVDNEVSTLCACVVVALCWNCEYVLLP